MLGHVRRHVNKGETKSRYIAGKLSNLINTLVNKSLNNGPIILFRHGWDNDSDLTKSLSWLLLPYFRFPFPVRLPTMFFCPHLTDIFNKWVEKATDAQVNISILMKDYRTVSLMMTPAPVIVLYLPKHTRKSM